MQVALCHKSVHVLLARLRENHVHIQIAEGVHGGEPTTKSGASLSTSSVVSLRSLRFTKSQLRPSGLKVPISRASRPWTLRARREPIGSRTMAPRPYSSMTVAASARRSYILRLKFRTLAINSCTPECINDASVVIVVIVNIANEVCHVILTAAISSCLLTRGPSSSSFSSTKPRAS